MRVAVVGHVEWIRFARVEDVPAAGEIAHSSDDWEQAGGGGAVAAVQLALLADEAHLFTVLGTDELGSRAEAELVARGVVVHAAPDERAATLGVHPRRRRAVSGRSRPSGRSWRRAATTTACRGTSSRGWTRSSSSPATSTPSSRRDARTCSPRPPARSTSSGRAGVELDALIGSGKDEAERYTSGDVEPAPRLVVTTSGALGGWAQPGGPFTAAEPPAAIVDSYGAGDSFAAGLTFALGSGARRAEAIGFAARCGAAALTGSGVAPQPVSLAVA